MIQQLAVSFQENSFSLSLRITYSCTAINSINSDPASCQAMQDEIKRLKEKLDNMNAGKAQP